MEEWLGNNSKKPRYDGSYLESQNYTARKTRLPNQPGVHHLFHTTWAMDIVRFHFKETKQNYHHKRNI